MKNSLINFIIFAAILFSSCQKIIDVDPISNIPVDNYYRDYNEVNRALTGAYNGLQGSLYNEWMMTDLRSDNSLQGVPNSSSAPNIELNELDMFTLGSSHPQVYNYWIATYNGIRSLNYVLKSLGVKYENKKITVGEGTATMNERQKEQLAGEALFLRAYYYFNLVRLFGGVFLITEPVSVTGAKQIQRSTIQETYDLIIADLSAAKDQLSQTSATDNSGHATTWAAKSLLAKVYLTLGKKSDALPLLNDVISNSGHALLPSYADVFSITNEMNKEIIFAVRYKAGGLGLGSPFANLFAPISSGSKVVNNDGNGYNFPTADAIAMYRYPASTGKDARRDATIAFFTSTKPYVKKYLSPVVLKYDAENDYPVIRFSDVLLMKAEALGYDGASGVSVGIINQIRARAGAIDYPGTGSFAAAFYKYPASGDYVIDNEQKFKDALLLERRIELAYENQRFFDMLRLGDPINILKSHFANEYTAHYSKIQPAITLAQLQSMVTQERMILPIPQREIDTNNEIVIPQNPGY